MGQQLFTSDSGETRAKEAQHQKAGEGNGWNSSDGHQVTTTFGHQFCEQRFFRFRATADQQLPAFTIGGEQQPAKPQIFGVPLQVDNDNPDF